MQWARAGLQWHRPLLRVPGAAVRDWLRARGEAWVEDPTNRDERYTRNRIRAQLLPILESAFPSFRETFARSAANAAQAAELLQELARELKDLAEISPEKRDTTLLMAPACFPDFLDFNDFLELADAMLDELELGGILQVASFHPRFQFEGTEVDDVTNCTNRAPYPTLHLLREDSIDKAVEAYPEAEMIYERNMQTLEDMGLEAWLDLDLGPRCPITGRTLNTPNEEK